MTTATWITGNTLDVLRRMPDNSVDMVMTSSPYWAQRSYLPQGSPEHGAELGQEASPAEFLASMLGITDELMRVVAPHGSVFWNLGDTAAFSGGSGGDYLPGGMREGQQKYEGSARRTQRERRDAPGRPKAKSVCWIPSLFGASLAYGRNLLNGEACEQWITRTPVTWCKENPNVGELIDAYRDATELIVVAVAEGRYYFDLDAVREERNYSTRTIKSANYQGHPRYVDKHVRPDVACHPLGAPPMNWWPMASQPYKGSHYAVMPPSLCEIPIRSGCPERVCTVCSTPWERLVRCEKCGVEGGNSYLRAFRRSCTCDRTETRPWVRTEDWVEPCSHGSWRPGIVLDPFGGSGTTLAVATGHGRDAIGIDLDKRNADMARDRVGPMFFTEATVDQLWPQDGAA